MAFPAFAIRLADTIAVMRVELTKVVASGVPFHRPDAPSMKSVPFMVRVKSGPRAATFSGLSELMNGGGTIFKLNGPNIPLGATTCIDAIPGLAINSAVTATFNCEEETKVVGNDCPFH